MKSAERDKARELRIKHKLGYSSIIKQIHVSRSTLTRWLKDLPLTEKRILQLRREGWSRGEAHRERIREAKRKKREARELEVYKRVRRRFARISRDTLLVAGLVLYLAEGDKKNSYHIGLSNTDPQVISFFVWWLQEFLNVPLARMRVQLHLYENMDLEKERRFWVTKTGLPRKQFYKDQIRPVRPNSFSYSESFRHGTCKIYVNGLKESRELMLSIRAFFDRYDTLRALRS